MEQPKEPKMVLDEELARQIGLKCHDCNSAWVVYGITAPCPPAFPAGAYCYKCLLTRARASHMIPMPMPTDLLDKLKADLGLNKIKKWYLIK